MNTSFILNLYMDISDTCQLQLEMGKKLLCADKQDRANKEN